MALHIDDPRLGNRRPILTLVPELAPEVERPAEILPPELFAEASQAANDVLDNRKARLLADAYASGDTESLINILVVSNVSGVDYETQYNAAGDWGRLSDGMRIPRKGFPDGVSASFGGGVFGVEIYKEGWNGYKHTETKIEQFIVIPPTISRRVFHSGRFWPEGMIIIPGADCDPRDPQTLVLTTHAQGPTRLMHKTNGDIVLGRPLPRTNISNITSKLQIIKDIAWSAQQKMACY